MRLHRWPVIQHHDQNVVIIVVMFTRWSKFYSNTDNSHLGMSSWPLQYLVLKILIRLRLRQRVKSSASGNTETTVAIKTETLMQIPWRNLSDAFVLAQGTQTLWRLLCRNATRDLERQRLLSWRLLTQRASWLGFLGRVAIRDNCLNFLTKWLLSGSCLFADSSETL